MLSDIEKQQMKIEILEDKLAPIAYKFKYDILNEVKMKLFQDLLQIKNDNINNKVGRKKKIVEEYINSLMEWIDIETQKSFITS